MDDKAKVGAHGVFDAGARIDKALEALLPRLILLGEMWFGAVTSLSEIMIDLTLFNERRARVVGQVDTDNAVSSLAETC